MNIFFLDRDPVAAASYHCDKHVVKMIVETAQLLSTALRLNGVDHDGLYKKTHYNHPSAVWVRSSRKHYDWTLELFEALCTEYTMRYGKIHATDIKATLFTLFADSIKGTGWTDPPQCMPDQYKNKDTVVAYRDYYIGEKRSFAKWKTNVPSWWE